MQMIQKVSHYTALENMGRFALVTYTNTGVIYWDLWEWKEVFITLNN